MPFWEDGGLVWLELDYHPFCQVSVLLFILVFKSSWFLISSVTWNSINSVPQPAVTTFAFASVTFLFDEYERAIE